MDREKLAWAAGLFEGEGCFSASVAGKGQSLAAVLRSTDKDVVENFAQVMGVGMVYGPYQSPKLHWKPQWQWSAQSFEEIQAAGAMMWPWLCSRRRARFKEVLSVYLKREGGRTIARLRRNEAIRGALSTGVTQCSIAALFNLSPAAITHIKQGAGG